MDGKEEGTVPKRLKKYDGDKKHRARWEVRKSIRAHRCQQRAMTGKPEREERFFQAENRKETSDLQSWASTHNLKPKDGKHKMGSSLNKSRDTHRQKVKIEVVDHQKKNTQGWEEGKRGKLYKLHS